MYTDPGILSLAIAVIVGAIIAVPTYLIIFRNKLKEWWKRKNGNKS